MLKYHTHHLVTFILHLLLTLRLSRSSATLQGTTKPWHTLTLDFDNGPPSDANGDINPFYDYRLDVTFKFLGTGETKRVFERVVVPGFFAGDGNGGSKGKVWQCRFVTGRVGKWRWTAVFVKGERVSVQEGEKGKGDAFDGETGGFTIEEEDGDSGEFVRRGKLRYVGGRYLRWAGNGEYFLKLGTNTPENALGYKGFAGLEGSTHEWKAHEKDWREGDPDWDDGKGKAIIGMVNYLASVGCNSLFSLVMTIKGDSKGDVHPFIGQSKDERTRYSIERLEQWQVFFQYCVKQGIALNLVFLETENEAIFEDDESMSLTDGFADSRKLFYREMVARFSHTLGMTWTLGEENGWNESSARGGGFSWGKANSDNQRQMFTEWIRNLDPYQTPMQMHTLPEFKEKIYMPLLGPTKGAAIEGASLQTGTKQFVFPQVLEWVQRSGVSMKPWVVTSDEIGQSITLTSEGRLDSSFRRDFLYGNIMAEGAGVELYNGAADITLDDFREFEPAFLEFRRVLEFFQQSSIPFWILHSDASQKLTEGAQNNVLSKQGHIYVIYKGEMDSTVSLDLSKATGNFTVNWFRPVASGGGFIDGGAINGGSVRVLKPPNDPEVDWLVSVTRSFPYSSGAELDLSVGASGIYLLVV